VAEALWSLSNLSGLNLGLGGDGGGTTPEVAAAAAALVVSAVKRLPDFFGPDLAKTVCAAATLAAGNGGAAPPASSGGGSRGGLADAPPAGAAAAAVGVTAAWARAVIDECEYQLVEFSADFTPFDLARLALGIALLQDIGADAAAAQAGGAAWPEAGVRLREALLKAVYARTRTIEEKAAVDFALARLDAKGKRSMHYDPRWTHEELNWLPR
jgi:hypothetical protein